MKRKLALLLSLVLVFSLVLSGCGDKNEAPAGTEGEGKVEEKKASNNPARSRDGAADTLVVGTHEAKGDFLPGYSSEVYDSYVADLIFSGLFTNDKEGNPIPHVAKDWEISEDHKTYTFHLRDDVKCTDGEPLTAEDVKFTYEFLADPTYDGPRSSYAMNLVGYKEYNEGDAKELAGVKVIDEHTVAFEFEEALSTNIWNCGMGILPKHIYDFEKGDTASLKKKMSDPIGSGPYILKKFEPKQYVEFEANADYFLGAPKVPHLIMKFTTVETQMSELEKGTIDIQLRVPSKAENKEIIDGTGFVNINEYPDNGYSYMGLNTRDPRLADKRVRQALTYGFNRQQFVDVYYGGNAQVSNVPVSQVSWAYTTDINEYPYDPDKAIALLEEAGWKPGADGIREKDGMKLSFVWDTYTDSKYVESLIPMLKADWEKIGVKVEPNLMEFGALSEKVYDKQEFDMYNMAWSLSIDPDAFELFHSSMAVPGGFNSVGFINEENDKLLEAGRKEFDQDKRAKIYQEWSQLMNEELPYIFMTQNLSWDAVNERVQNFNTSPFQDWTNPEVLLNVELAQ